MLLGAGLASAAEISGNVTLTTDYVFRGISQTDESPALQGGLDLGFDSGFYVGTWASSVDFDTNGSGYDGSLELDLYVGYGGEISEDLSYDVGFVQYVYPGDEGPDGDYYELYGSLAYKDFTVGAVWTDDYYAETGDYTYLYGEYSLGLPADFSLAFHAGYNFIDEDGGFLSSDEDGYTDYSVALNKSWLGVDWSLGWYDTTLDDDDVFGTDWADGRVVFSVTKSM